MSTKSLLLMISCALVVLVIVSEIIHRATTSPAAMAKKHSDNEAKFQPFFDKGVQAIKAENYADGLASLAQAEQAALPLTDDQFAALSESRRQVAAHYEAAGQYPEAEGVYEVLVKSGIDEGSKLSESKQDEAAVKRLSDALSFIDQVRPTMKRELLFGDTITLGSSLVELHRYSEAEQAWQRLLDYLRANSESADPDIERVYVALADVLSKAGDWHGAGENLALADESSDKMVAQYSGMAGQQTVVQMAMFNKTYAEYWLAVSYQHEGEMEQALFTADRLFAYEMEHDRGINLYQINEVAGLGLQIARAMNNQDAKNLWQQRAASLGGGGGGSLNVAQLPHH